MQYRIPFTFIVVLVSGLSHAFSDGKPDTRPNIVVIFTDDHGWADLSSQGVVDDIRTPHLDRLAADGVRATNGYVTAPQCVPSRAGLLTGRYQSRFGVESNRSSLVGFGQQQTIAERLKAAGYATGHIGKWHLGPPQDITSHGFDDVFYQGGTWTNFDLQGNDVAAGTRQTELYHIDAGSEAASAFIRRHHEQPFFLYVAYRAPHTPLDAPPKYTRRFPGPMPERRRQALAMISAIDDGVGRMVATLEEFDLENRTLIFFIGDNGAPLKIHKVDSPLNGDAGGWDGSLNAPMNGEKGMLSEGGIRVPWLACWKGRIPSGQICDDPVISLDVAATAVAAAGLEADPTLDGVNLLPLFCGEREGAPHEVLNWRWEAQTAIRVGRWKLLRGGNREYLFDLHQDPGEHQNLIDRHAAIADELRQRLTAWAADLQPPGIAVSPMSPVWNDYYDFYLDGKPAPPPRSAAAPADPVIQGWVLRGGRAQQTRAGLALRPKSNGAGRMFLTKNGLKLTAPVKVTLRYSAESQQKIGFSWRLQGQSAFPQEQTSFDTTTSGTEPRELNAVIGNDGELQHIRILLPDSPLRIESLTLTGSGANQQVTADFTRSRPE